MIDKNPGYSIDAIRKFKGLEDEVDLRKLFGELIDNKFLVVLCVAIFGLFGVAIGVLSTPIYKSSALIQVEDNSSGVLALDDIGDMFASNSSVDTELYILKSRLVLGQTVDELGLDTVIRPNYFPFVGKFLSRSNESSNVLADPLWGASYAWGGEKLEVSYLEVPEYLQFEELTLVTEGADSYSLWYDGDKLLTGQVNKPARSVEFDVHIKISKLFAHIGTEFNIIKKSRLAAIMILKKDFIAKSLGKDTGIMQLSLYGSKRDRISNILNSISSNYVSQNVLRLAAEAENSLSFIENQLPKVKTSLVNSEVALNKYRETRDSVDLTLETESLLSGFVKLESEISTMTLNESEISRRFTVEHPAYQSFKRQQRDLIIQRDQLDEKINGLPETQQKILTLMRDFEVNQAIYLSLQSKTQELSIVKASMVGNVRVLDSAIVYPEADSPKKPLIFLMFTFFGFFASVTYVLVKNALDRGVRNPEVFEDNGFSVFGTIPSSPAQNKFDIQNVREKVISTSPQKPFSLAIDYPADISIEALRGVRTSLHFSMLETKNKIIMITSGTQGVGKSFVTQNLAIVLTQLGMKVLLIDADLRRGFIHKNFGEHYSPGLSDYLFDHKSEFSPLKTNIDNLDILPRGALHENPSELLMSKRFSQLLDMLGDKYDFILVDTPPVLAVTDPSIVGRYASTNLVVARYEMTTLKDVQLSVERLRINGVKVDGVIFNGIEYSASNYYCGFAKYSYSYESEIS